jgi:hypothetical protein
MPNVINCPSCERRLNVPDTLVGEAVKCPTCGETFTADPDSPPPRRPEDEAPPAGRAVPIPLKEEPEDEARPRRSRYRDEDHERDEVRRRRRPAAKPGPVQAVGVMMLVGGIIGIVMFLGVPLVSAGACCLWPGTYYSLVMGILAIIQGAKVLGDDAREMKPPRWVGVMMIINVVCGDVVNLALGIVCLCLLNDREVERYFRG